MQLFKLPYMRNRGKPDYISQMSEYMAGLVGELDKLPDPGRLLETLTLSESGLQSGKEAGADVANRDTLGNHGGVTNVWLEIESAVPHKKSAG